MLLARESSGTGLSSLKLEILFLESFERRICATAAELLGFWFHAPDPRR
jgi:hypothetical protein